MTKGYEQRKASNEKYLAKLDEIKIRLPKGKKAEYQKQAEACGKSLNQFIIDRIEGVPRGYTMRGGKIEIHEPEAKMIRELFTSVAVVDSFISRETFDQVQEKLKEKKQGE